MKAYVIQIFANVHILSCNSLGSEASDRSEPGQSAQGALQSPSDTQPVVRSYRKGL